MSAINVTATTLNLVYGSWKGKCGTFEYMVKILTWFIWICNNKKSHCEVYDIVLFSSGFICTFTIITTAIFSMFLADGLPDWLITWCVLHISYGYNSSKFYSNLQINMHKKHTTYKNLIEWQYLVTAWVNYLWSVIYNGIHFIH